MRRSRSLFQSTPPVKAATIEAALAGGLGWISIHAAREGGDNHTHDQLQHSIKFQSTPPVKAATVIMFFCFSVAGAISIHAAREGGDGFGMSRLSICGHFNPRRP